MAIQTQNIYIRKPQINTAYTDVYNDLQNPSAVKPSYSAGLRQIADKRYVDSLNIKPVEFTPNIPSVTPNIKSFTPQVPSFKPLGDYSVSGSDLSTFNLGNTKVGETPSLGNYSIHEPLSDQPYNYLENTASKGSIQPMLSNLAFGVTTGIQSISNINRQAAINEPDDYKEAYDAYGKQQYNEDYSDLYQQSLEDKLPALPTYDEVRGKTKNEIATDIMSSGFQGAMSGLSTGNPWLALVGAGMGALTSGIGAITGKNRAKQAIKEAEAIREKNLYRNQKQYQYGLDNAVMRHQYDLKGNIFSMGGFFPTGIEEVSEGGSHEQNPLGGIPMGVDANGVPNLVEEGEVIFNDYVFSNRLTMPDEVRKKYKFGGKDGMTFADAASKIRKKYEERPNDPITKNGIMDQLSSLMAEQELLKESLQLDMVNKSKNKYAAGGLFPDAKEYILGMPDNDYQTFVNNFSTMPNAKKTKALGDRNYLFKYAESGTPGEVYQAINNSYLNSLAPNAIPQTNAGDYSFAPVRKSSLSQLPPMQPMETEQQTHVGDPNYRQEDAGYATWMRYAPVVGAGLNVITDLAGLTNKPDYKDIDAITDIAYKSTRNPDIEPALIGNYLQYNPLDTNYMANQAAAQASATRQAIQQNANGNRAMAMAGMLAADRNAQNNMGDLYMKAAEYNAQQRNAVEGFNRGTNQYNADNVMKARIANKQDRASQYHLLYDAAVKKAMLKAQLDAQASANKSANLTNLFDSLGNIGKENMAMNMVNSQNSLYYSIDKRGNVKFKNAFYKLPKNEQEEIRNRINSKD